MTANSSMAGGRDGAAWDYYPLSERFRENAIMAGAVVAYGATLAQLFNPAALGLAAAFATGAFIANEYKYNRQRGLRRMIDRGEVNDLSPPDMYLQDELDRMTDAMNMPRQRVMMAGMNAHSPLASISTMGLVTVSRIMKHLLSPAELRFAIAHEASHLRCADSGGLHVYGAQFVRILRPLLLATAGISALLGAAAGIPPMEGLVTMAKMFAGTVLAGEGMKLACNYVTRITERRADRNALYLTGALEPGLKLMDRLHHDKRRQPAYAEMEKHPSYHPRVANLRAAWEKAVQYPPAPSVRPPAPADDESPSPYEAMNRAIAEEMERQAGNPLKTIILRF